MSTYNLSIMDSMDLVDDMDKRKNSTSNKSLPRKVSKVSMEQLYNKLYKSPYYEVGFHNEGEFRRRLVKRSDELVKWVCSLRNKYPLFILSHGHSNPKDARGLDTERFLTHKLFLDFDGENLPIVKDEVDRFVTEFQDRFGGRLYVQFSGGKGYHVYILLKRTMHLTVNEISALLNHLKVSFKLEYLDESVISNPLRLARAPLSIHENGNQVEPLVWDPQPSHGLESLINGVRMKVKEDELFRKNALQVKQEKMKANKGKNDIQDWNVVDKIIQGFFETGRHVQGTKHVVCCPFHSDSHPSAFYDDKVFHCSTCGVTVGSYRLLTELMGKGKGEALDIIKGLQ